jgi:hypothetical protein
MTNGMVHHIWRSVVTGHCPTFDAMVIRLDRNEFNPPADFLLISIISTLKEYSLAHQLNINLRYALSREADVNDLPEADALPLYARYVWDDELACRSVQLLGNRPLLRQEVTRPGDLFGLETVELLVPELSKADFFLQLIGNFEPTDVDTICSVLNAVPGITRAYETPITSIKDLSPLQS